ncbi:hypothetical protein JMJ77_0014233 [Colletotrichum scovillei]|uniref:Uncharacterized protein n=1 Tax=Colletotrichum scovillei TaxID=1209932 RepID=A0A9P7UBT0_9PEZI|nr:hypothetical protein JMJ77_0014233 [Colletotrichum scovillei]KAG7065757.1 hypothetical protein JMJ78_0012505 [Colletotrichum scovillei]KAG7068363.1 hypothetical protein JMJ76_0008053 [Colletotrichum scovillei]
MATLSQGCSGFTNGESADAIRSRFVWRRAVRQDGNSPTPLQQTCPARHTSAQREIADNGKLCFRKWIEGRGIPASGPKSPGSGHDTAGTIALVFSGQADNSSLNTGSSQRHEKIVHRNKHPLRIGLPKCCPLQLECTRVPRHSGTWLETSPLCPSSRPSLQFSPTDALIFRVSQTLR